MAEDNSWVFDSLVCFLHGPIWNAPLQTFIEENSLIFDPNLQGDESNPEYEKIHDEYKNLVDFMLGSFMEEMQISPEQFEIACLEGRHQASDTGFTFHQGLFQQIWAANDLRIFVRMMTQRNLELQLQALDLIERRQNSTNKDELGETSAQHDNEEEKLKENDEEKAIVETVDMELKDPKPIQTENVEKNNFERLNLFFEDKKISSADVKSRQEYLRAQRDKILQIKKKARARQLDETVQKNGRPSSAQVAKKLLDGDVENVIGDPEPHETSFQLRKTLAKRLRAEVVEQ